MADREQLEIIHQGVSVWNRWRAENPGASPDLFHAFLHQADLRGADLRAVDLQAADLSGAELGWAHLEGADLRGADMGGIRASRSHLSETRLNRAHLRGADLTWADLTRAHLAEADLSGADLSWADLTTANLSAADLSRADLRLANMSRADLRGADLTGANLSQANLDETDLTLASAGGTNFAELDLSLAKGLNCITHRAPSFIDIRALYQSGARIPEAFMRGCGVPDDFIAFAQSLVRNPVEFYSCFIVYSNVDRGFAERLFADLQTKNVRCWLAERDVRPGDKIGDRMDRSIRMQDNLIVALSEASVGSEWIDTDLAAGLAEERLRERRVLFPVRLDDCALVADKAWAHAMREQMHICDFTEWKYYDAYQKSLACLLADLKAGHSPGTLTGR